MLPIGTVSVTAALHETRQFVKLPSSLDITEIPNVNQWEYSK